MAPQVFCRGSMIRVRRPRRQPCPMKNCACAHSAQVVLLQLPLIKDENASRLLVKKLGPPLVTLLSEEPEVQYVALRNIGLICQRYPEVLQHEIKVGFFVSLFWFPNAPWLHARCSCKAVPALSRCATSGSSAAPPRCSTRSRWGAPVLLL